MTAAQRVRIAFEGGVPDRVPIYQAGFSSDVASRILGRTAMVGGGHAQYREACALLEGEDAHREFLEQSFADAVELCRRLELDVVRTTYWRMPERPARRLDEHTFLYGDEGGEWCVRRYSPASELYQVVGRSPRPDATIDDVERSVESFEAWASSYEPDADELTAVLRAMDEFGESGVPYGSGGVGVGLPHDAVWIEAVAARPDLIRRYFAAQAERGVLIARAAAQHGIRYLYGGGDFASSRGPFLSPRAFRELMLPALQRISAACDEVGALHGFASDGDLWALADDLFGRSGIGFYYEVDAAARMQLRLLRERFPRLALMGGVNSATLHRGSREDVMRETREALSAAREHGGCIVGCSNQIVAGTPMGNFRAMMDVLHAER